MFAFNKDRSFERQRRFQRNHPIKVSPNGRNKMVVKNDIAEH